MNILDLGYEVLVQPAIFAITVIAALFKMSRGFYREEEEVAEVVVRRIKYEGSHLKAAGIIAVAGILITLTAVVTPFGHRAVIWSAGGIEDIEREPGLSAVFPILQAPIMVDVREKRFSTVDNEDAANAFVQSKELLEVTMKVTLIYNVIPDRASELIDKVGPNYESEVISFILYDAVREVSGDHDAPQFSTEIDSMADKMFDIVAPQLLERGINVRTVTIEDAVFKDQFVQAVLDEEVAEREADEQENLERAEIARKNIRITAAEATAEEERLKGVGEGQRIEAVAAALGFTPEQYLEWVMLTRWNGILPSTLVGDAGGFDLLIGIP